MYGDVKTRLIQLMHLHQEDALTNFDREARDECRCGQQGDQFWRAHFADVLMQEFEIEEQDGTAEV